MIARHFRSLSVTMLLLCAAGAIVAASAWTVEMKTDRGLRVVVAETQKPVPRRDANGGKVAVRLP